jgi:hypothetical protein
VLPNGILRLLAVISTFFSVSRFWLIRANSSPSVLATVVEIGQELGSGREPPLAVPQYG